LKPQRILVTGGAGFIGSNLVHRLLNQGHQVTVFDNLSRSGCDTNLAWLREMHPSDAFKFVRGDLSDFKMLQTATEGVDRVYHLAGQVAVNAQGTFNALEAARLAGNDPIFLYASTNKVYGGMEQVRVVEGATRYSYADLPFGVPETQPLDFHSPYGCSKGAGDQYVHDYARIYNLRTVVVRQSCIYGYRQFGIEDQGWVAWFIIAALLKRPISIYGNGKQVRDILFIEDLLDAYEMMVDNIGKTAGQVFNIGGGPQNTISIWTEFGPMLEELVGHSIPYSCADWRPGDQPVYISDIRKAVSLLGWQPQVTVCKGIERLFGWIRDHQQLFSHL
jgi:CDP-paratose 2-epimerase